jgi:AAA domain
MRCDSCETCRNRNRVRSPVRESLTERLLTAAAAIRPRAIMLDPFVRLRGARIDESSQKDVGPVLDFLGKLRDESGAAVIYSHHTGHQGSHQRGSSDLEGFWESRVQWRTCPRQARSGYGAASATARTDLRTQSRERSRASQSAATNAASQQFRIVSHAGRRGASSRPSRHPASYGTASTWRSAQRRQDALEDDAVKRAGCLGDVNSRVPPPLYRLADGPKPLVRDVVARDGSTHGISSPSAWAIPRSASTLSRLHTGLRLVYDVG